MHATALARRLDMAGVAIPPHAGVFSALGLLLSPPRVDLSSSVSGDTPVDARVAALADRVARQLEDETGSVPVEVVTSVDVRYRGQSHETTVPYRAGEGRGVLERRFHEAHFVRNGFAREGDPIETVTIRAAALGAPVLTWADLDEVTAVGRARRGRRSVLTVDGTVEADVWWRPALAAGAEVTGPAVVEEPEATVWIGPDERAVVHSSGALEVEW